MLCSHLRYDTLAQMLTLANIHAGSKVLVFETCAGLVLGAVMERMGGMLLLWTPPWSFICFTTVFSFTYKENLLSFLYFLNKAFLSTLCTIILCFFLIQAMAQWSKCTQEVGQSERVWRALASLHIFTICCMNFPSAMSALYWQALWTPLPKTPVLVGPAFLKDVYSF